MVAANNYPTAALRIGRWLVKNVTEDAGFQPPNSLTEMGVDQPISLRVDSNHCHRIIQKQ